MTSVLATLGQICELRRDFIGPTEAQSHRYVALEHLDSARTNIRNWQEQPKVRSTKSRFKAGDVLYGKLRPYLRKAAFAAWPGVCSTELLVLRARPTCDPQFLAFVLHSKSFLRHAISHTGGVNHPRVSWSALEEFECVLPPLREQRAIAAVLAKIQKAIDIQSDILATLKELKISTIAKLFSDHRWPEVILGDLARIGNGSTPNRNEELYWAGGSIPWLTSSKVHEVIIESADEFVTNDARAECHLPMVPPSTIVVAITGQGKTLGHAALVKFETCVNQHLAYITVHSDRLLPEFLLVFLQSQYEHFRAVAQAGGTTKGALTCGYLKSLSIPVPSLDEQRVVASSLQAVLQPILLAQTKQDLLEELFSSTLDPLISGKIAIRDSMAIAKE